MTTNAEFYDLVMGRLGRSTDNVILRPSAPKELVRVLQNLDNSPLHPWFLETRGTLATVAGEEAVALPTDFLDLREDSRVWVQNSEGAWKVVTRGHTEDLRSKYINAEGGLPKGYDLLGSEMLLGPVPDEIYTLRFLYYKKTTAPADNSNQATNEWIVNAEDLVSLLLAARLARWHLRNRELADDLRAEAKIVRRDLYHQNESRKHTDMDYAITD